MLALRIEDDEVGRYEAPANSRPIEGKANLVAEPLGTKAFFSLSVEENLDALYGTAVRLTSTRADAEDLVAECVSKAWMAIDTLEDRSRFRPWVFRILRNCLISDFRKRAVRPRETAYDELGDGDVATFLMDEPDDFLRWWANPEQAFFSGVLADEIMNAINNLPESFRVTILLVNVEGLTYDEAAEALGVPKGTVRSRMKRGRTLLQKALWLHARDAGFSMTGNMGE